MSSSIASHAIGDLAQRMSKFIKIPGGKMAAEDDN